MTVVLYDSPGTSPSTGGDYISPDWEIDVAGSPAVVLSWARSTNWTRPNWWDFQDTLTVSWLKFGLTGEAVSLTITPSDALLTAIGGLTAAKVYMVPARSFSVSGNSIIVNGYTESERLMIIVGDYANGGTRHPLAIQSSAPRAAPTGTVVIYNGSQTAAETGKTLHFTGPAVYETGEIAMQAGSNVEIDGDVIVVGQFRGLSTDDWAIDGHGALSGEFATWDSDVSGQPFTTQFGFTMIRGTDDTFAAPEGTSVNNITIFASPFYAIHMARVASGVMILSPWTPNTDGLHLTGAATGDPGIAYNCLLWVGDDCIGMGEEFGQHQVSDCLLASSASAVFQCGYFGFPEYDEDVSTISNIDVMAVSDFSTDGDARFGHIVNGYTDASGTAPRTVLKGYRFDNVRVWADPGRQIRAQPIDLANKPDVFGTIADQLGNVSGFSFTDINYETAPINLSRIVGTDARNTPSGVTFRRVTYGDVRLSIRNAANFIEFGETLFNVTIDGASLTA